MIITGPRVATLDRVSESSSNLAIKWESLEFFLTSPKRAVCAAHDTYFLPFPGNWPFLHKALPPHRVFPRFPLELVASVTSTKFQTPPPPPLPAARAHTHTHTHTQGTQRSGAHATAGRNTDQLGVQLSLEGVRQQGGVANARPVLQLVAAGPRGAPRDQWARGPTGLRATRPGEQTCSAGLGRGRRW